MKCEYTDVSALLLGVYCVSKQQCAHTSCSLMFPVLCIEHYYVCSFGVFLVYSCCAQS